MQVALLAEWEDVKRTISDTGPIRHATLTYLIVMVALSFFYIIFSILLLHGIKGDRRIYSIPWLIWSILYMLVTAIFTLHKVIDKALNGCEHICLIHVTLGPLLYTLFLCIWFYCFVCVLEYWRTMRQAPAIPHKKTRESYMSPSIQADSQDFEMDEKDPADRLYIDAFSVQNTKQEKESKSRLITSLRRNASTRRVVYPDLVWQRSRDDLLGNEVSNGIYTNLMPMNHGPNAYEYHDEERHYQNLLPGYIV